MKRNHSKCVALEEKKFSSACSVSSKHHFVTYTVQKKTKHKYNRKSMWQSSSNQHCQFTEDENNIL